MENQTTQSGGQIPAVVSSGSSAPSYLVVHGYTMGELEGKVNSTMQEGFRPTGGVFFSPMANEYIQAMIYPPNP